MGQVRQGVRRIFAKGSVHRSPYDAFMLRLHDFLKTSEEFQERSLKRLWTFPPSATWLLFSDACPHAELRGRHALEHSFFIEPSVLASPELSPAALLERLTGGPGLDRVA